MVHGTMAAANTSPVTPTIRIQERRPRRARQIAQAARNGKTDRIDGLIRTPSAQSAPYPAHAEIVLASGTARVAQKMSAMKSAARDVSQTHVIGRSREVGRRTHPHDAATATDIPKLRSAMP